MKFELASISIGCHEDAKECVVCGRERVPLLITAVTYDDYTHSQCSLYIDNNAFGSILSKLLAQN